MTIKVKTRLGDFKEEQQALIEQVNDLCVHWPDGEMNDQTRNRRARLLLQELERLSEEMSQIFLEAPVSALHDSMFGWSSYEVANGRLNLVYLLLFGCTAHNPKTPHPNDLGGTHS